MDCLRLDKTEFAPEVLFDHQNHSFYIRGTSRPEDVSEVYSPVIQWINDYRLLLSENADQYYSSEEPLILEIDLEYFNSSSAKYLYDIIEAFKKIKNSGIPVEVAWIYDEEDNDMKEAGEDLAVLAEFDFAYIPK